MGDMTIKWRVSADSNSSINRRARLVETPSCSSTIVLPSEIKEEELGWKNEIPPGVKFVPSQEEIIYYLLNKVYTGSIDFGGVIRDIDLYKYEPENLKDLAFEGESRLYFFTPLQKRYANGTRNKRETVNGFWKGTQTTKTILDSDNKHAAVTKTPFSYYHPQGKNTKKTQWLMDEYKLSNYDNHRVMLKNWALCVVHYKKRGGNDNNDEKEDAYDKCSNTHKTSSVAGSGFEAMKSTSQTSMIGSASEYALIEKSGQTPTPYSKHNTILFGNNYHY